MIRFGIFFLALFVCATSIFAKPPKGKSTWTIDDVVKSASAADFQISPDGRFAVWVKTSFDEEEHDQVNHLMRTDLQTGREVELTRGPKGGSSPRWSPDGSLLAFLSDRQAPKGKLVRRGRTAREEDEDKTKTQIWLLDPTGGEPWALTDYPRDVTTFAWGGKDKILFLAQEEPTHREKKRKDDKDTTTVVEDEAAEPPVRLYEVDVESKSITRLTDNGDRIEALYPSPDGKHVVTIHGRSLQFTYDNRIKPIAFLRNRENGEAKRILDDPKLNLGAIRWMPDSKGFYATEEHCSQAEFAMASVTRVLHYDLASGSHQMVDLAWERGLSSQYDNESAAGLLATRDGFLALLADGVKTRVARYIRAGNAWKKELVSGEHVSAVHGFQLGADGKTMVYATSTATSPTRWFHARLENANLRVPKQLARLNDHLEDLPKARVEIVRWKGALDEEVEGLLYYPHDYQKGKKYPLIVMIHGGPASADLDSWDDRWSYAPNLVCQKGAFVLKPNYHGSTAYGLQWLESITRGKYGDLETVDIEKGVDALLARGLVDADKLALCGWSNGAILTNILVTRTTRYKAAVAGAGNVEYISDWANCEFGDAFDRFYLGKSPLEDPELYLRKSPFFQMDKVRTPTLIFFGSEDRVVPTSQGWVQYRALQQLGKTSVRFVTFPGEGHGLKKLAHQRRKLEEELAWYDKHLFGTVQEKNPAVKADSPLAWALARSKAKSQGGKFGLLIKDKLVPEMAKYQGMQLGRFEVTRAQFAAFDPKYPVPAGRENFPASGISFEQAKAYCKWLSNFTGNTYRLPNGEESDDLYDDPDDKENTLDHWAGYAVNPDDAALLREEIAPLPGPAPLLQEVGRFRGVGEESLIFDLGGNVAEWVIDKNGKGELRGGSADMPARARRKTNGASTEYQGFRVVLDEDQREGGARK